MIAVHSGKKNIPGNAQAHPANLFEKFDAHIVVAGDDGIRARSLGKRPANLPAPISAMSVSLISFLFSSAISKFPAEIVQNFRSGQSNGLDHFISAANPLSDNHRQFLSSAANLH